MLNNATLGGFAWFLSLVIHYLDYSLQMGLLLWKNKSLWLLLLFLGYVGQLNAQVKTNTAKVRVIDNAYRQARISISQKKWLSNNYTINLKRHNLNRSGYYHYSERLYYALPNNQMTPLLQLALVRTEKENVDYQQEFLFSSKGKLIYFHEKQNDIKKLPYREVKVYFEKGKLLVWNQNNQTSLPLNIVAQSPKEKVKAILKKARLLQKKLKQQMEEEM